MNERRHAHAQISIHQQGSARAGGLPHGMHPDRVAQTGGGGAQHTVEILPQGIGSIEIHPFALPGEAQAGQKARQSVDVVAMHVADEDAPQLGHAQRAAQELMLRALATVEQPELSPLRQAEGHRRDIAGAGGDTGAGAKKGDLHNPILAAEC